MILAYRPLSFPDDWAWFNSILPVFRVEDSSGFVAVDASSGERVAAVVLDNFTGVSAQGHFIIETPMAIRAGFFDMCADFIFNELCIDALYALVPGENEKALKLNRHLGFTEVARLRGAVKKGVDSVVMELLPVNCGYLKKVENE
jgi:RimJ/RimL family protein N-acetyltransferase